MSLLQVQMVNKSFAGLRALSDVNLNVEEGSVHAIIGPNGAGKSTLLNCFVGRLVPDTGSVLFNGKSLIGLAPHEINQAGVARVFQTPEVFSDLTLEENVTIPTLSRGDKRRLELAMCLVQDPKLLLLDEPTAGMSRADTEKTIELLQRIGGGRITKVIIEHDMQVVFSLASRISVLAQGTVIAEGDPAAIKADARVQEAYLGGTLQ